VTKATLPRALLTLLFAYLYISDWSVPSGVIAAASPVDAAAAKKKLRQERGLKRGMFRRPSKGYIISPCKIESF
jgi:hypothetical protein